MQDSEKLSQSYKLDEGDVTLENLLLTPVKKHSPKSWKNETVRDFKSSPSLVSPDSGLESIRRRTKPDTKELLSVLKIIKKLIDDEMLQEMNFDQAEKKCSGPSVLEVLRSLVQDQIGGDGLISGSSTRDSFERFGYITLVNPKQRLFTLKSMQVDSPLPDGATEVFITNLEPLVDESTLVPVLEKFGSLVNLRIPIDVETRVGKGFAFAVYTNESAARRAMDELNKTVLFGNRLVAKITNPKKRLFVANLPKSRTQGDLDRHFKAFLPGFKKITFPPVIVAKPSAIPKNVKDLSLIDGTQLAVEGQNNGFCFLEFYASKEASLAKKVISTRKVFGVDLFVDWADA